MRFLKAFGRFWYDFIIGDDWKIAAAVVVALFTTFVAMQAGWFGDAGLTIFGAVAVMAAFSISLAVDVRQKSKR